MKAFQIFALVIGLSAVILVVALVAAPVSDDDFCRTYVIAYENDIQAANPDGGAAPEVWVEIEYKGCLHFMSSPDVEDSTSKRLLDG